MTPRKILALVALVGIVPAIAIIRLQMTPNAGGTAASLSSIALFVTMVIIPAFISEHLWRKLQGWIPEHRTANYYTATAVATTKTRQRALLQYKEITTGEADYKHHKERLLALYEQAYREGLNAQAPQRAQLDDRKKDD
jgi:hypothetical protein